MSDGQLPGPVLIGLEGWELKPRERDWLQNPQVGGVVLFSRNYHNLAQLELLNESIRSAAHAPMLICVDHEGGRVQRFQDGFTRLPPLGLLGRMHADAPELALDYAYRHARVMATELLVAGVDHSFAPVLDLDVDSCVIGDRAFSAAPAAVADLGRYYLAGMHDAGMRTCGKHFPGHGSVRADSHTHDVLDGRPLAALERTDLVPFKALLGQLDAVMMAHVCYPEIDAAPAGYSAHWIQEVLRAQCDWSGVVLSDDLGMHAAAYAGKLRDRLFRSLEAGCDAVLVCQPEEVDELLHACANDRLPSAPGLLKLHGRNRVSREELQTVSEWRHWQQSIKDLEHCQWA